MIEAFLAGDLESAVAQNAALLPVFTGVFATQGCMMVKATLAARGFGVGPCRAPMGVVDEDVVRDYAQLLDNLGFTE